MSQKTVVMYTRSSFSCPFVKVAERVFRQHNVSYQSIDIDHDMNARERVLYWTGFLSIPTIVVAADGEVIPLQEPVPLTEGASPRGIDRGDMITEPSAAQLEAWLMKHGILMEA